MIPRIARPYSMFFLHNGYVFNNASGVSRPRNRGGRASSFVLKAAFHGPPRHGAKGNWAEIIKIADRDTDTNRSRVYYYVHTLCLWIFLKSQEKSESWKDLILGRKEMFLLTTILLVYEKDVKIGERKRWNVCSESIENFTYFSINPRVNRSTRVNKYSHDMINAP